jgi:hexosaminidase
MPQPSPKPKSRFRILFVRLFLILVVIAVAAIVSLLVIYEIRYEAPQPAPLITEFSFTEKSDGFHDGFVLLPVPQQIETRTGFYDLPEVIRFEAPAEMHSTISGALLRYLDAESAPASGMAHIRVQANTDLPREGYRLTISASGIDIEYGGNPGLYYGVSTLGQIHKQLNGRLPALEITDWPDLPVRGVMLDISRDKIPTMETLYDAVDMLAMLRYNHLQLYVEGFSFGYPSFRDLWEETETPVTGDEMQQLEQYAAERMIELVPNQNMLGHMASWLETERFAHLAECPDGFMLMGLIEHNSTLDLSNPESLELVKQMTDDMLPYFSSGLFNANLDEPFELGQCNTRELAAERGGAGFLYLDFLKEINSYVRENHGKQMMIWGDIAAKHPEIIPQIPENIILIEWGYESVHPFDEHAARLSEAGIPFLLAPGTSSWTTFTGRTDNMTGNIDAAVNAALTHGGLGILLTDWGDLGHWQYWPVSWAPITYGAAVSWNHESRDNLPLTNVLNEMIFRDSSGEMGAIMLDLGRYNQFEEYAMVNMTTTMQTYMFGILDPVMVGAIQNRILRELPNIVQIGDDVIAEVMKRFENPQPYNYRAILNYTAILGERLQHTQMDREDAGLIIDELTNAIRMIRLGALTRHYVQWMREYDSDIKLDLLTEMKQLIDEIIPEHERLWLARNRSGGLDRSLQGFITLQEAIESEIKKQQRNPVIRRLSTLGDKLIAAGAALYIDR